MDELAFRIVDAWDRLVPRLLSDAAELRSRLLRKQALKHRPPRAWCIALRASHQRLDRFCTSHPDPGSAHQVMLGRADLVEICSPVGLCAPGQTLVEVAARLGTRPCGLLPSRVAGKFQTHHIPGLGGRWGKPRPLLYTRDALDPASRLFTPPDPFHPRDLTWFHLAHRLPPELPVQTFTRIARFHSNLPHFRDTRHLHPEHPAHDPPVYKKKSLALPPPEPDPVWYKWKDGQYLGYDWRNPHARAGYERHQKQLARSRSAAKERRKNKGPALSQSKGSIQFRGWQWSCPHCARHVNLLYFPLAPIDLGLRTHIASLIEEDAIRARDLLALATQIESTAAPGPAVTGFACERCHTLRRYSRADPNAWNEFVSALTHGLLRGRDVSRPPHLSGAPRKFAYTPRPNRDPSIRRPQIERLLLAGHTFRQIAKDLNLAYGTILWHAQQVYKEHNVRSLPELLKKHSKPFKTKKIEEVRQRLAAGQSVPQIASEMGISAMSVYNHVYMLRRTGRLHRRSSPTRTGINLESDSLQHSL